jgi:hypothetical protein
MVYPMEDADTYNLLQRMFRAIRTMSNENSPLSMPRSLRPLIDSALHDQ